MIRGEDNQWRVRHLRVNRVGPLVLHEWCWRQRFVQMLAALVLLQKLLLLLQQLLLVIAENERTLGFRRARSRILGLFPLLLEHANDNDEEKEED